MAQESLYVEDAARGAAAADVAEHEPDDAGFSLDGGSEGAMMDGPIATSAPRVLTQKERFELYKAVQSMKGAYVRLLRLLKQLDIPFPS